MKKEQSKLLSYSEILNVSNNMERIESQLGHRVPTGLVSMYDLSERPLSYGEIIDIANNIKRIERSRSTSENEGCELVLLVVFCIIGFVVSLFN